MLLLTNYRSSKRGMARITYITSEGERREVAVDDGYAVVEGVINN